VRGSARFRLQILSRDGSGSFGFNFFTAPRGQGVRGYVSADSAPETQRWIKVSEHMRRRSGVRWPPHP